MILEALGIIGISFVGTIIWVFSPEATAILYGSQGKMPAVMVGALCTVGQALMLTVFYHLGGRLTERWAWLRKRVERTKKRFDTQLHRSFLLLSVPAGIFGIPPALAMSALARGFDVRLMPFLFCAAGGRFLRFTFLAASGEKALEYFTAWLNNPFWTIAS